MFQLDSKTKNIFCKVGVFKNFIKRISVNHFSLQVLTKKDKIQFLLTFSNF